MGVLAAFVEGWKRTIAAPATVFGMLAVTLLCALPVAILLHGQSQADEAVVAWNTGWATQFTYETLGFPGTIANISGWLNRGRVSPALAGALAGYLGIWIFLSGGVLDRLARARPIRTAAFFSACGGYFARFLRLAVMAGLVYWALFRWLQPYLVGSLHDRWTRNAAFLLALMLVNVVVDFTKVRAVVEDRRSTLGAIAASLRFLRRRPLRSAVLYLLNALTLLLIVRLWYSFAYDAAAPDWTALVLSLVCLLLRLAAKLALMASEIAFFQGELAHAGYVVAPVPVWPDSPAVEAIEKLSG